MIVHEADQRHGGAETIFPIPPGGHAVIETTRSGCGKPRTNVWIRVASEVAEYGCLFGAVTYVDEDPDRDVCLSASVSLHSNPTTRRTMCTGRSGRMFPGFHQDQRLNERRSRHAQPQAAILGEGTLGEKGYRGRPFRSTAVYLPSAMLLSCLFMARIQRDIACDV